MTLCFKCGATLIEACPNSIKETQDKLDAVKGWAIRLQDGGNAMMRCNDIANVLFKLLDIHSYTEKANEND